MTQITKAAAFLLLIVALEGIESASFIGKCDTENPLKKVKNHTCLGTLPQNNNRWKGLAIEIKSKEKERTLHVLTHVSNRIVMLL